MRSWCRSVPDSAQRITPNNSQSYRSGAGRGRRSVQFQSASPIARRPTKSPSSSPISFPLFEIGRNRRPSSILAAIIQASIPCLTQRGIATVRTRPPFPQRSGKTHRPSRISIPSTSRLASRRRSRRWIKSPRSISRSFCPGRLLRYSAAPSPGAH